MVVLTVADEVGLIGGLQPQRFRLQVKGGKTRPDEP